LVAFLRHEGVRRKSNRGDEAVARWSPVQRFRRSSAGRCEFQREEKWGRDCELLGKEESVLSYLESKARTLPPLVENVGPGEDGGCGFGACDAGWREEVGGGADGRGQLVSE
jgi:hypothetical protein